MTQAPLRVLVLGYGNPGRLDDGLGPALVTELENRNLPAVTADATYLLEPEDAELVSRHDLAIFVDAAVSGPEPFAIRPVRPAAGVRFSSHSLGPEEVMGLAHELFGSRAQGYVLAVRGYQFDEFGERLSEPARGNLCAAGRFLEEMLRNGNFELLERAAIDSAPAYGGGPARGTPPDNIAERRPYLTEGPRRGETSLSWGLDTARTVPRVGKAL
jgi:hydrogenase maturation protease